MTLLTKPNMQNIWASGGDIVEPTNLKKQQGWTAEVPPFQFENWIQNRQDQYLAHINQRGIPAWDGQTEYEAGGLSYVQGSDGKVYKSVAASGPATTTQDPTTDVSDTYWTIAFADAGAFLTEAVGDARYAQRSNNLSDLTNVAAARTNLALGTAATATLTTSSTDGTVGRVLKVGDFGVTNWALDGNTITSNADNLPMGTVVLADTATMALLPPFAGQYIVSTYGNLSLAGALWQTALHRETGTLFTRTVGETGWQQSHHTGNLLQTTGTSTEFPMSQKAVTDALGQPSMTGSATLNGTTDNTVQLTGIVTTLGLEVGDVIRIQYSGYDKLHTVESITDANSIIVNYEHAGNRRNGSLKLANQTATLTIKLISKWYNAPLGLGQAWLVMLPNRANSVTYTNLTGRPFQVGVSVSGSSGTSVGSFNFYVDEKILATDSSEAHSWTTNVFAIIPHNSNYRSVIVNSSGIMYRNWVELR